MKVVDHAPHDWFLLQQDDALFLDVNCNHSAAGYSVMILLSDEEGARYSREGSPYLDQLAHAVQNAGPGSALQRRDVGHALRDVAHQAFLQWRVTIRPATLADVPDLARLHVQTYNETHGPGPSAEIREPQWRQKISSEKNFCFVALDPQGAFVGFANGEPYELDDLPYDGRLEKIYVLKAWHRQGIGRRLFTEIAKTFLSQGIHSMLLFSQADNPSIGFFERLGGQRLLGPAGDFHGGYGWPDIRTLTPLPLPNSDPEPRI